MVFQITSYSLFTIPPKSNHWYKECTVNILLEVHLQIIISFWEDWIEKVAKQWVIDFIHLNIQLPVLPEDKCKELFEKTWATEIYLCWTISNKKGKNIAKLHSPILLSNQTIVERLYISGYEYHSNLFIRLLCLYRIR